MRLLFVTSRLPALPCHDGARLAAAQLIDQLARSHTIAVVAATGGADGPAQHAWLAERAAVVATVPLGDWRHACTARPTHHLAALNARVLGIVDRFGPDVIHLEGTLLAPLSRGAGAPTVLACHEAEVLRAREARRGEASVLRRLTARVSEAVASAWMRDWAGTAAACVVDSEEDRHALAEHVPSDRIEIVAGGIDEVMYAYRRRGDPSRLVFTGDFSSSRDVAAARRLAHAILPRVRREIPRAELLLAGARHTSAAVAALAALPGVRVTGALADVRPTVWGAGVYVSPLHAGFGRAARLREPMALGTPVVASGATLVAMPQARAGEHVLVADSDAEFAQAIGV